MHDLVKIRTVFLNLDLFVVFKNAKLYGWATFVNFSKDLNAFDHF